MGTDFSIKPTGTPTSTLGIAPSSGETQRNAVATLLPAAQTVTSIDTTTAVRAAPREIVGTLSHQVTIDRAAAMIVYQIINDKTGEVVKQYPAEGLLRRRAYMRAQEKRREAAAVAAFDRNV